MGRVDQVELVWQNKTKMKFPGGEKIPAESSRASKEARGEKAKSAEESSINDSFQLDIKIFFEKSYTDLFVINVQMDVFFINFL